MRLPIYLSSTVLIATAILGINTTAYAQCKGGWCPIPNAYYDQNAPSQYGYNQPNRQGNQNPYWQGNQNPNWQGNQNPNWRNDNGWRGGSNQYYYYNNPSSYNYHSKNGYNNEQAMADQNPSYQSSNGKGYYYRNLSDGQQSADQSSSSDRLLQHKIEDSLKNNYLKKNFKFVNARVYNGNVTLSGSVENEQDRQDLMDRVRGIQGVQNINDQVQIGSTAQTSYNESSSDESDDQTADAASDQSSSYDSNKGMAMVSDQDLQKQIDDTLKNNYLKKNYDAVNATVSNGRVTVSGMVESEKDHQEILDRLKKINGITNINDHIQVGGMKTSYNTYKKPAYER